MRTERAWKTPGDEFWIAVDFTTWELQSGETLVDSNGRGALSATVVDPDGNDVTSEIIEGAPLIDMIGDPDGDPVILPSTRVLLFILAGTAGVAYQFTVSAPTSDGELLTSVFPLEVRSSYVG